MQPDWTEQVAQSLPEEWRDAYRAGVAEAGAAASGPQQSAGPDHFAASLERAAREPAPPEKLRGVARLIGGHKSTIDGRQADNYQNAVLEVHIPGREPYTVRKLSFTPRHEDVLGAGFPVLVKADKPEKVEFLWDEMPDERDAAGQRIGEAFDSWQDSVIAPQGVADAVEAQRAAVVEQLRARGIELPGDGS